MNNKQTAIKIFKENFQKIYKYFYFKTFSKVEAEDLTSETFLKFVEHINAGLDIKDHKNYLFGIARNKFADFLRRKYKEEISIGDIDQMVEEIENLKSSKADLINHVTKFIEKLPEKQRIILYARLIEKRNLNEIVELTGKDMNYVKTMQKRGIANLKKFLAESTPTST